MLVALGLGLAAIVAITIALLPQGESTDLPGALEGVYPLPNDVVVRQTAVEADLPIGYTLTMEVDGIRIPQQEMAFTEAVGTYRWQPGPDKVFAEWTPGEHTIVITWDSTTGRPDPGEFTWTFRVV